jgi:hypothetical protein
MQLDEHEKNLLALAVIGAILRLGKLLADGVAHESRPPYYALCFVEYRGI